MRSGPASGAGLAGLTAARKLDAAGASVTVVEARDRVGGRTKAGSTGGVTVGEVRRAFRELGELARDVPADAPWKVETASEWSGYIDGAVESGGRGAREVLSDLAGEEPPQGTIAQGYTHRG